MLKELLITTVATIFSGLVTAAIISSIKAPETSHVTVRYNAIEVPNPLTSNLQESDKFKDYLSKLTSPLPLVLFNKIRFTSALTLVSINIRNATAQRSGPIDISLPDVALWYLQKGDPAYSAESKLSINAIDPNETRDILAITQRSSTHTAPRILEGGRSLETSSLSVDDYDDPFGLAKAVMSWPFLAIFAFPMAILLAIILLLLMVITLISNYNIGLRARITSKEDIRRMRELITYIDQNVPEKA